MTNRVLTLPASKGSLRDLLETTLGSLDELQGIVLISVFKDTSITVSTTADLPIATLCLAVRILETRIGRSIEEECSHDDGP